MALAPNSFKAQTDEARSGSRLLKPPLKALDPERPPGCRVNLDHCTMQLHRAFGDWESGGEVGEEAGEDRLDLPPEDGFRRPAHSGIAEEGGASREDLLVGGLDVRVRPDDG
jgi:hypothetical protein